MALIYRTVRLQYNFSCVVLSSNAFSNGKWTPSSLVLYRDQSLKAVKVTVSDVVKWYEDFSGVKMLREAHEKADMVAEAMEKAQEMRRIARHAYDDVQKKLQEFQYELRNISRDDDKYIQLIREEHSLLKESKVLQEQLKETEAHERETFEKMMTALRRSHETERLQAAVAKYGSIFASIIGAIIGFVGTTINNNIKLKHMKNSMTGSVDEDRIMDVIRETLSKELELQKKETHKVIEIQKREKELEAKRANQRLNDLVNQSINQSPLTLNKTVEESSGLKSVGEWVAVIAGVYLVSKLFGF